MVKSEEKWIFPKEWLEMLKKEFHYQLPNRKIWLIIDNKPKMIMLLRLMGQQVKLPFT